MMRKFPVKCLVLVFALVFAGGAGAVEVNRVVSPGGLEAWLVEDRSNPIISMSFAFRGGAALDPDGKEGLADLVSSLLDEGAGPLDSKAFQQTLEDLSIRLGFSVGRDTFRGRLRTLTKNQAKAFELLKLALTEPRFDDEPVSRIRQQSLISLKRDMENPDALAGRTMFANLYPNHPYGRPVMGTLKSVEAITTEDLRAFVKRRLARENLIIGVVGDITAADLAVQLDAVFGGLPAKPVTWLLPEATPNADGRVVVVDKDVPQSAVMFAGEGIKRDDPDYYVAYVMNHILGGGSFTSRLYQEVREKRGLVYGVYSSLHPLDFSALILADAGTANARVKESLDVIGAEWTRMATGGVTAEELADAKTFLTGSFPLRFTSSANIAGILVGMQRAHLGIDYLDKRNGFIEAVTAPDIQRVAKRILKRDKLVTVIVGKPEGVTSSP